MSKHTPGKWCVGTTDKHMVYAGEENDSKTVADCFIDDDGSNLEEEQANARLISAAPCLLAACKRALHLVEENNEDIVLMVGSFGLLDDLQRAIARAEGAS